MRTWKQYGVLAAVLVGGAAASVYGFFATGGAMPMGKRFGAIVEGGATSGGGPLVNLGRGVVTPEPVDVLGEFVPIVIACFLLGRFFFAYAMATQEA